MSEIFRVVGSAYFLHEIFVFMLFVFIAMWKWSRDHMKRKELSKRDRIEKFNAVILDSKMKNNPYVMEQSFLDRYDRLLAYKEIKYFLKQENPSHMIVQYLSARNYLRFNSKYTHLVPRLWLVGDKFKYLSWAASFFCVLFATFGFLGLCIAVLMLVEPYPVSQVLASLLITIFLFLYAGMFFEMELNAKSAFDLKHITKNKGKTESEKLE